MTESEDKLGGRGRRLNRTQIDLQNGVHLQAKPFDIVKGRYWEARQHVPGTRYGTKGMLIGEWRTWQRSHYARQPEEAAFGSGGGVYTSRMFKESWLNQAGERPALWLSNEKTKALPHEVWLTLVAVDIDRDSSFQAWVELLKALRPQTNADVSRLRKPVAV